MTISLNLTPDIETNLLAQAQARGLALEEYLFSIVENAASSPGADVADRWPSSRSEAVKRMLEFGEEHHIRRE